MSRAGRTLVVGDVHGCADELDDLLDRAAFTAGDRLILVGDLVVRGPFPRRVIATVRRLGGTSVRGNHEARLLAFHDLKAGRRVELSDRDRRIISSTGLHALADELEEQDWRFLRAMPLYADVPEHDMRVVHAGVLPEQSIEKTPARVLLYLRTLREDGSPSEQRDGGAPWGASYVGPPHVCFGHNALSAPQIHPWATGLDTACVYGGRLTALVLSDRQPVPMGENDRLGAMISVPARRAYHPGTR